MSENVKNIPVFDAIVLRFLPEYIDKNDDRFVHTNYAEPIFALSGGSEADFGLFDPF